MEVEFGYVREYNAARGFGFVSRTFNNTNRPHGKDVWFHITKIKHNYPDLAKELDSGLSENVSFWYEVDKSERERVGKIWLEANDIPVQTRDNLATYIEQLWRNIDNSPPHWLEQVTIALVGQLRKNELNQIRNNQIRERKEAEDKERIQRQSRLVALIESRKQFRNPAKLGGQKARMSSEPKHVYIGLPEHLAHLVLWVAREYRTNPLSHIPGGSDVVVEYHDGQAFGYDWIKKPSVYISTFFAGIVGYTSNNANTDFKSLDEKSQMEIAKRKIARFFARRYKDEYEYSTAAFVEVWNSETSNEMPWKSLERFERRQQNQHVFEEDYDFKPQSVVEYYGYEPGYENPIDRAERLYGIPDPRLVED